MRIVLFSGTMISLLFPIVNLVKNLYMNFRYIICKAMDEPWYN
jgi:hypothetical protein